MVGSSLTEKNWSKTKNSPVLLLETSPTAKTFLLLVGHHIQRAQAGELRPTPANTMTSPHGLHRPKLHLQLLQVLGLSGRQQQPGN